MSAVAEAPSRNGSGPSRDPRRYREAVKATMKKREAGPDGAFRRVEPIGAEVDRFLMEAQIYGLEPLAGQIYATWDDGVMKTVAHIDGLRLLAERTGRYDGQDDPEWCDKEGNWTDYWPGGEAPLAARVRVHKKGTKVPTTGTANWSDFAPQSDVGEGSLWNLTGGKPAHMLSIRAEALALRKAFPSELSGLYTAEELGISLAAIGASGEPDGSTPAVATDVPGSPAPSPAAPPSAAPSTTAPLPGAEGEAPSVLVDAASEQPSGAPARPQAKRTLAETLADGEYERLRGELTAALFDQMPDRLTDDQCELLAATLSEAEEGGVTAVELERLCKVALREDNVAIRSRALREWISERRRKAEAETEPSAEPAALPGHSEADPPGASPGAERDEDAEAPSLFDGDPGPERPSREGA